MSGTAASHPTSFKSEVPQTPVMEPLTYDWVLQAGIGINPHLNQVLPSVDPTRLRRSEKCMVRRGQASCVAKAVLWVINGRARSPGGRAAGDRMPAFCPRPAFAALRRRTLAAAAKIFPQSHPRIARTAIVCRPALDTRPDARRCRRSRCQRRRCALRARAVRMAVSYTHLTLPTICSG